MATQENVPETPAEAVGRKSADAEHLGLGAGAILGGLVGGRALRLLTRVAIGRLLGASALGIFDLAWTTAYLLSFSAAIGLPTGVVRFGAALWREDRGAFAGLVRWSVGVVLLLSSIAGALMLGLAGALAGGVFSQPEITWAFRVAALIVPLSAGLEVLTAATRATQRMRHTALIRDLLAPLVQFATFLLMMALGYGVAAAVWSAVLGFLAAFLVAGWAVRSMLAGAGEPVVTPPDGRAVLTYSLPVALAGMIGVVLMVVDRLIVGAFRSPAEVGVYSAAAQLAVLSSLIASAFTITLTPRFADLMDRRESGRLADLLQVSTRWGLYLVGPIAVVLVLGPEVALVGAFGDEFAAGAPVLLILMLGQMAHVATGACSSVLMTGGQERRWLAFNGVALAINVVLDLVLIPRHGIVGAAWGSAVALSVRHVAALVSTRRLFGVWPYDARSLKLVPALLAAAGAVLAAARLTDLPPFWQLILLLAVAWLAMMATLRLIGFEPEDRATLAALMARLGLRRPGVPPQAPGAGG